MKSEKTKQNLKFQWSDMENKKILGSQQGPLLPTSSPTAEEKQHWVKKPISLFFYYGNKQGGKVRNTVGYTSFWMWIQESLPIQTARENHNNFWSKVRSWIELYFHQLCEESAGLRGKYVGEEASSETRQNVIISER